MATSAEEDQNAQVKENRIFCSYLCPDHPSVDHLRKIANPLMGSRATQLVSQQTPHHTLGLASQHGCLASPDICVFSLPAAEATQLPSQCPCTTCLGQVHLELPSTEQPVATAYLAPCLAPRRCLVNEHWFSKVTNHNGP